mgnify:FL=1
MTQKTPTYNLEKYDATDSPNLQSQYNNSMDLLDTALKTISNKVDAIPTAETLPDGLKAFVTALGLSSSNAEALGTSLSHFLNRTAASTNGDLSVANLAGMGVTAEGLPFVKPASTSGDK